MNRMLEHPWVLDRDVADIRGSFQCNGSSAPLVVKGKGYTVVHTGTGVFTVTLVDGVVDILDAEATLQLAVAADSQAQIGVVTASAGTVVINVLTAGTLADIAADANNRINFTIRVRISGVTP